MAVPHSQQVTDIKSMLVVVSLLLEGVACGNSEKGEIRGNES